ncbi:MAG: YibE/F family protein [Candidatus Kerfeldbacteria bacterium]|nr:YibE/F family protein [Candidatus Kerfeldbacteria bacterium]
MNFTKKNIILMIVIAGLIPWLAHAQTEAQPQGDVFTARVTAVVSEQTVSVETGGTVVQQVLKLRALDGERAGQELIFDGTKIQAIAQNTYAVGDKVIVAHSLGVDGADQFYVVDFVRRSPLYWLAALFAAIVVVVGRLKGIRALFVLALSFLVIFWFIIPQIVAGSSPLVISIIGTFGILVFAIYLTEGFHRSSTIAVTSIFISLVITALLALWFTALTKLTGFASEEAIYLIGLGEGNINIRGLLLAGIIIGALGVLDDVAVSQTALVGELRQANPRLTNRELYRRAMRVGISHMGSMVNTLFFAYAGAALPLLILFSSSEINAPTFSQGINSEMVATEIVRTMVGSIGLILAVPITTALAVWWGTRSRDRLLQDEQQRHQSDPHNHRTELGS